MGGLPRWSSCLICHVLDQEGEEEAGDQFSTSTIFPAATFLECVIRYARKVAIERAKCDIGLRWSSAGAAKLERNAGERCLRHEKRGLGSFRKRLDG